MKRVLFCLLLTVHSAVGLIFYEAANPPANTETAPTGAYANAGWQHQIVIDRETGRNLFFGTIISPKHFVTARHLGLGQAGTDARIFVTQPDYVTGTVEKTYTLRNAASPSAIQYFDLESMTTKNSDLYVYEIWETFPAFAEIFSGSDELGQEFVMTGFGDSRGTPVIVAGEGERGWNPNPLARLGRWGTNTVDGFAQTSANPSQGLLIFCDFDAQGIGGSGNPFDPGDADATPHECQAANKDSGGGWFIKDGGVWKLAGINFSVDIYRIPDDDPPVNKRLAVYDGVGLYHSSSPDPIAPCSIINGCNFYRRSHTYATRVSEHIGAINTVIQPAKDSALLSGLERFEDWAEGYGLSAGVGPTDDDDSDGLTNLEEYLTESDPSDEKDGVFSFSVDLSTPGTHVMTLVESLDLAGRGITTELEVSGDLDQWDPVTGTTEVSNEVDSLTGTRTRELSASFAGTGAVYYRLKVTL